MYQDIYNIIPDTFFSQEVPRQDDQTLCQTPESRKIFQKMIQKIAQNFQLRHTKYMIPLYAKSQIQFNPENFSHILASCKKTEKSWKCPFSYIVITEDEATYEQLKQHHISSHYIISSKELDICGDYEIIFSLDCDRFIWELEQLPHQVSINNIQEIIRIKELETLSQYKHIMTVLQTHQIDSYQHILSLFETKTTQFDTQAILEEIEIKNKELQEKISHISISGTSILEVLQSQSFPVQIQEIIDEHRESLPFVTDSFPLALDEEKLQTYRQEIKTREYKQIIESILELNDISHLQIQITKHVHTLDFVNGLYHQFQNTKPIKNGEYIALSNSKNMMLSNPQPITYHLENTPASIITGANSGGKTTLLEHIVQLIILKSLRLPAHGEIQLPEYDSIYYFAKNKGSANKGAFETLLTQLATIKPGSKTLILADEMEAVTEPTIAAKLITQSISFFVKKGCHCIFASHLGGIIQNHIEGIARIDGIFAKGLDEKHNVIIDHNPIMGQLANSTPQLIIEKLAKTKPNEFFDALLTTS